MNLGQRPKFLISSIIGKQGPQQDINTSDFQNSVLEVPAARVSACSVFFPHSHGIWLLQAQVNLLTQTLPVLLQSWSLLLSSCVVSAGWCYPPVTRWRGGGLLMSTSARASRELGSNLEKNLSWHCDLLVDTFILCCERNFLHPSRKWVSFSC